MLFTTKDSTDLAGEIKNYIGDHVALIAIAENTGIDYTAFIDACNEIDLIIVGGVFPKVIHDGIPMDEGVVVNTLKNVVHLEKINGISTKQYQVPNIKLDSSEAYTLITYVDGLTSNISNYLDALYSNFGLQVNYLGGGAGSLSLEQQPCVFTNDGISKDAAVYCITATKSHIGVKHGWTKVDGPFIATKTEGNIIQELNWQKPFNIYKEVVEAHSGSTFKDDNFFDIAKGYPFGILRQNAEAIVRDPLMLNDEGSLVCVGEVEENTMLNILSGDNNSLISAAHEAVLESAGKTTNATKAIVIDCISRVLFLDNDFQLEMNTIKDVLNQKYGDISFSGALTLGEISSYGKGILEFYNKTIVIALFE